MVQRLLVAGSNSGHQLGVGHDEDVRTFREALCQMDSGKRADQPEMVSFPPAGYTVIEISSGASHTLALLEAIPGAQGATGSNIQKQIWVTGTGAQGQLGPAHASNGSKSVPVFTRLDLDACLGAAAGAELSDLSEESFEPTQVLCGWNCSYIVLTPRSHVATRSSDQDVLVTLGLHRDNTFGELGCSASASAADSSPCVHIVSFAAALVSARLDTQLPYSITQVAAGLRHAVAALSVRLDTHCQARTLVVGWGSARHGQVGRIPEAAASRPSTTSRRPGPAPVVVTEPRLIFDWRTKDARSTRCKVCAGKDHTVVLVQAQDGEQGGGLHSMGLSKQGQLVHESALPAHATLKEITHVTCNWNSTHLLLKQQAESLPRPVILSCGSNSRGQLGNKSRKSTTADSPLTSVDLAEFLQLTPATSENDPAPLSSLPAGTVTVNKMVSGSEHSLLLVSRHTGVTGDPRRLPENQVWGWGWNEHGNLAQGVHDEADHDQPVLLLDGTRTGTAQSIYTPLNIWAGCGTTFVLAESA